MAETSAGKTYALDSFKDRLSQHARDTTRPALANQSRGRALSADENALAEAMMAIFGERVHDFAAVAAALKARGVKAPISGRKDWDLALLEAELAALNAEFDASYAEHGYGA